MPWWQGTHLPGALYSASWRSTQFSILVHTYLSFQIFSFLSTTSTTVIYKFRFASKYIITVVPSLRNGRTTPAHLKSMLLSKIFVNHYDLRSAPSVRNSDVYDYSSSLCSDGINLIQDEFLVALVTKHSNPLSNLIRSTNKGRVNYTAEMTSRCLFTSCLNNSCTCGARHSVNSLFPTPLHNLYTF
jgi:hypothetical protein